MKRRVLVLSLLIAGCGDRSEPSTGRASPSRSEPAQAAAAEDTPQAVESAAAEDPPADAEPAEATPSDDCEPSIVSSPEPVSQLHVHGDTLMWIGDHDEGDRLYVQTPRGATRVSLPGEVTDVFIGGTKPLLCVDHATLTSLTLPSLGLGTVVEAAKYDCQAVASGDRLFYDAGHRWRWVPDARATPIEVEDRIVSDDAQWIDGDTVYWRRSDRLEALSPATETEPRIIATGLPLHAEHQVVHGDHVYWANRYQVVRMPKAGGAIEAVARVQALPQVVAVDDSHVVWTIQDGWARLAHGARELERFHEPQPDSVIDDFHAALADDGTLYFARRKDREIRALPPDCAWSRLTRHVAAPKVEPPSEVAPLYLTMVREGFRPNDWSLTELGDVDDMQEGLGSLDPTDPRIPARYRPGTAYELVSPRGRASAKIASVSIGARDSELLFDVLLGSITCSAAVNVGGPDPYDELERCVGEYPPDQAFLVFRAGEVPEGLNPRIAETVDPRRELPAMEKRELFERVVPITVAGKGRYLASVERDRGRDFDDPLTTGLALLNAHGTPIEWIHPVDRRHERYFVRYLVDLDGDGRDEVVYEGDSDYGHHVYLLEVDPSGETHSRVIGGDTDFVEL